MDIKNERKLFEAWFLDKYGASLRGLRMRNGGYDEAGIQDLWEGWLARANVSPWVCSHAHKPAPDQFVFAYISIHDEPRLVGYDHYEEKWFYVLGECYLNSADDEYVKSWMPIPKLPAEVKK